MSLAHGPVPNRPQTSGVRGQGVGDPCCQVFGVFSLLRTGWALAHEQRPYEQMDRSAPRGESPFLNADLGPLPPNRVGAQKSFCPAQWTFHRNDHLFKGCTQVHLFSQVADTEWASPGSPGRFRTKGPWSPKSSD